MKRRRGGEPAPHNKGGFKLRKRKHREAAGVGPVTLCCKPRLQAGSCRNTLENMTLDDRRCITEVTGSSRVLFSAHEKHWMFGVVKLESV